LGTKDKLVKWIQTEKWINHRMKKGVGSVEIKGQRSLLAVMGTGLAPRKRLACPLNLTSHCSSH
jgi:hypothetical protein